MLHFLPFRQVAILLLLVMAFFACSHPSLGDKEEKRANESEMEGLMNQEFIMTMDPALGYVPTERLIKAKEYRDQLLRTMAGARTASIPWEERGPMNVAGRVRGVLIDRRDPSGNTIFAAGVSGGIWRAINFKSTPLWTPLTDLHPNIAVTCLAQDPTNLNVMYAGTGEGWFNTDAVRGNGIMKSLDGGITWNFLTSTLFSQNNSNFDYVQDIIVTGNGTVYASTRSFLFCNNGGVFRSTDGGASWVRVIGSFPAGATSCNDAANFRGADLEIASNGDLYATTGFQSSAASNQGRIWRSPASLGAQQGTENNWTEITPAGTWRRIEVAIAPSNPNVVYALLQNGTNNTIGAIKRSDNAGATWVDAVLPVWCDQGTTSTDFTRTQAWYNLIARVDPNNPLNCYIGGVDILKTNDGGANWVQVTQWAVGCSNLPQIHADIHEILFFGNSSTEMIAATDGGVYYSNNGGNSWQNKNLGFNITQFYSVDHHPSQVNYFLGGTQDNGTQKFNVAGVGVTIQALGGDGGFAHIDQTDGLIQIAALTGNNYRVSRNGGNSFNIITGGSSSTGRFINPTDYDDALDVLYAAHNNDNYGFLQDLQGTTTPNFVTVPISFVLGGRQVSAVKVDPNIQGGGSVWMATGASSSDANISTGTTGAVPILFRLSNANTTNPTVDRNVTLPLAQGTYVSCIEIEKGNPNHMLVTVSNYGVFNSVLESNDGGLTWVNIEGNLPDMPVRWALFAPPNAQLQGPSGARGGIILATQMGVWTTTTTNGSATTWVPNNNNFVNTRVDMLKYREVDNLLMAATHGRGMFTATIPSMATSVNPVNNTRGFIQYISASQNQLLIKTGNLTGVRNMRVNLFDSKGRLVLVRQTGYTPATVDIASLAPGMYIVKIFGNNKEVYTQQIIK